MALEAIPQALWFFLPAFVANPMAVVFGGGPPIDFGRTLGGRERLFGDGKTWRGPPRRPLFGGGPGVLFFPPLSPLPPRFPRVLWTGRRGGAGAPGPGPPAAP